MICRPSSTSFLYLTSYASLILLLAGCGGPAPTDGADPKVTAMGTIEVTAKLVDIP